MKEQILNLLTYRYLIQKEIYEQLKLKSSQEKKELRELLQELLQQGLIYKDSKNRYHIIDKNMVAGAIAFTKSGSMAFVQGPDLKEVAVSVEDANGAIHRDKVLVEITGRWRDLPSGRVIRIIERQTKKFVGTFENKGIFGFVVPLDQKINTDFYISPEDINGAKPGEIVEIEIIKWAEKSKNPQAKIISILGNRNNPKIDLPIVLSKHALPAPGEFPKDVLQQAKSIPDFIDADEVHTRKDFRKEIIFTIDGDDAKDFDDAVQIDKLPNGNFILGVHIADVSHYVPEGTELDKEAFERGTSVYLIDTVIPMLPHELSDWMCSLVEKQDRLTMSLIMEIDKTGTVIDYSVYNGIINSVKRLTYSKVNKILNKSADPELVDDIGWLEPKFILMNELMEILRNNRKERGAITAIEGAEVYFEFDDQGRVKDIIPRERGISEVIIEEFMIKANETIASIFDNQGLPFIYRVHETPDPEMIVQFRNYVDAAGVKIKMPKKLHPKVLEEVLEKTKDSPLYESIQRLLVRSLKRAVYSDVNIGHFGLASESYTHFTSPIRRYPDLIVHRLLKRFIENKYSFSKKEIEKYSKILPNIANHSSKRERIANEAEWDLDDMKKAEYISNYLNVPFEVVVTSVTKFGIFVEIPKKMINGLIHISQLKEYYRYDEKNNRLVSENSSSIISIGDKMAAAAVKTDKLTGQIDFIPYEENKKNNSSTQKVHKSKKNPEKKDAPHKKIRMGEKNKKSKKRK